MKLVAEYSFWHYPESNCVASPKSSVDCIVEGSAVTDAGGRPPFSARADPLSIGETHHRINKLIFSSKEISNQGQGPVPPKKSQS